MTNDLEYELYIKELLDHYVRTYNHSPDPQTFLINVYNELVSGTLSTEDGQALVILGSALIKENAPEDLPKNLPHTHACLIKSYTTYKFNRNESKDDPSRPKYADY